MNGKPSKYIIHILYIILIYAGVFIYIRTIIYAIQQKYKYNFSYIQLHTGNISKWIKKERKKNTHEN